MSLPIYVDAYSGYKANERPRQFCIDEDVIEIASVEKQWRTPNGEHFQVRSREGKRYVLRYSEKDNEWRLLSEFDGAELLGRPSIELVTVDVASIRMAESQIEGCERCRPESGIQFDWILADVLRKRGAIEFVLAEPARCPHCRTEISEKTLVEPKGGIEVDSEWVDLQI